MVVGLLLLLLLGWAFFVMNSVPGGWKVFFRRISLLVLFNAVLTVVFPFAWKRHSIGDMPLFLLVIYGEFLLFVGMAYLYRNHRRKRDRADKDIH